MSKGRKFLEKVALYVGEPYSVVPHVPRRILYVGKPNAIKLAPMLASICRDQNCKVTVYVGNDWLTKLPALIVSVKPDCTLVASDVQVKSTINIGEIPPGATPVELATIAVRSWRRIQEYSHG